MCTLQYDCVSIPAPRTLPFSLQVCRSSLLSSALKTLCSAKETGLPIRLFEISDAITLDPSKEVGGPAGGPAGAAWSLRMRSSEVLARCWCTRSWLDLFVRA